MRMSTKCRTAVNAMVELTLCEQAWPVPLAAIARRQRVSLSHLERLFMHLRTAGLVRSTRGNGGGYSLGRDAGAISVAAIVGALEAGASGADRGRTDLTDDLMRRLDAEMHRHMAVVSLAQLVAGQRDAWVTIEVPTRPSAFALRPRHGAVAQRPQDCPGTAGVPNSVFDLGTLMARGVALPRSQ